MDVERQLDIVTQQIVRAKIFYDIWWLYHGADTRPKIIKTMNNFSEFFRFDEHAHFVSMIVHCAVLWDKSSSNISIPSVAQGLLDPRRHSVDKDLLAAIASLQVKAECLLMIRHQAIAHRSAKFDYNEVFRQAQLTPDFIPGMLRKALDFANQLRNRKGLPEEAFREPPLKYACKMIRALGGPNLEQPSPLDDIFDS